MIKQKKVLIIEDNQFWAKKWQNGFNEEIISIKLADTIEEARELLEKINFDAIVMDALLIKNGDASPIFSLLDKIKSSKFKGQIIASSSSADYRNEMMKRGCDHEVSKDRVIQKLSEVLGF